MLIPPFTLHVTTENSIPGRRLISTRLPHQAHRPVRVPEYMTTAEFFENMAATLVPVTRTGMLYGPYGDGKILGRQKHRLEIERANFETAGRYTVKENGTVELDAVKFVANVYWDNESEAHANLWFFYNQGTGETAGRLEELCSIGEYKFVRDGDTITVLAKVHLLTYDITK